MIDRAFDDSPARFGSNAMSASQVDPHTHAVHQKQDPVPQTESGRRPIAPRTAVIGGLLWMVAGPMILFMSTVSLVFTASGFWTAADGCYAAGLGAMFAGRWLEFRSGAAETADGKPASAHDIHRYSLLLGGCGVLVWLTVSAIRTLWLIH